MCGIVAIMARSGSVDPEQLARGVDALIHRGPDGQRCWLSPDRTIGLGHTRLSIIDLAGGEQPISNEDGQVRIVVNGEFYDFERTQRELIARGHRLRTGSDSEIALHLYEELGPRCLEQLRGEFAFVLWDDRNDLLFAARDRFGVKPLFYAQHEGKLYLASELKALFRAGVPARWDEEGVYDSLHTPMTAERSLFRDVYQVPPGHYLIASRGHVTLVRYWDLDFPRSEHDIPEGECIEQTRSLLLDAVRLRLRADVPVGCYLSGGIDSAAILGLASSLRSKPIDAFTIRFADPSYDESKVAEAVANHVSANFHPVLITEQMLAESFADATRHGEIPTGNLHAVAKFILSQRVHREGFKVVLTGDGSDEIFAGYAHFRRDQILSRPADDEQRGKMLSALHDVHQRTHGNLPLPGAGAAPTEVGIARAMLGHVPSFLDGLASYGAQFHPLLRPELRERLRRRDTQMLFLDRYAPDQLDGRSPLHQSMYLWSRSGFSSYLINVLCDRMEMGNSIEARQPFLDHPFVEYARGIPASLNIKGSTEKYILREAARPYLPAVVLDRVKQPFVSPGFGMRPGSVFLTMLQDCLRSRIMDAQPLFDPALVQTAISRLDGDDPVACARISNVLTLVLGMAILHQHMVGSS